MNRRDRNRPTAVLCTLIYLVNVDVWSQNFISGNNIIYAVEDKIPGRIYCCVICTFLANVDHVLDTVLLLEFKLSVTTVV